LVKRAAGDFEITRENLGTAEMPKSLTADDFEIGMYVRARRKGSDTTHEESHEGAGIVLQLIRVMDGAASWTLPLRIEHIDLPMLVCSCACGDRGCKKRGSIDTREMELTEVSREFVRALRPKRWWEIWK
jgi:hypothetical protein